MWDGGMVDSLICMHIIRNYQSRQGLHIGSRIDKREIFVPLGTTRAGWIVGVFMYVPYLTARMMTQANLRLPRYRP